MTFASLDIIKPILDAIDEEGFINPSEIQKEALPIILSGRDLLASAQTGTGKTAAFALPIIQALHLSKEENTRGPLKALILAPTRELAEQIKSSFKIFASKTNIKVGAIYGGASQKAQEGMLNKGIDVLVATPGRLIDLMNQKIVKLNEVQYFVLDEADTLLDMGFIKDVKFIKGFIPKTRQTLMFSATISKEVSALASELLNDPLQLELAPPNMMLEKINHSVFYVQKKDKKEALLDLLTSPELESVLVFTRTKHGANKLVTFLQEYGLKADAIHGNKSQAKRQQALDDFKAKKLRVLVATDIAARGIDINELSHVINFDLPDSPETYIHRIGRTGRKGLKGEAYSFFSNEERGLLKAVEKHTGLSLQEKTLVPVTEDSKFRKVVDIILEEEKAKKQEKDAMSTKEKKLISTSPRDFGKHKEESHSKKRSYQNKASEAFIEIEEEEKKSRSDSYKKNKKTYGPTRLARKTNVEEAGTFEVDKKDTRKSFKSGRKSNSDTSYSLREERNNDRNDYRGTSKGSYGKKAYQGKETSRGEYQGRSQRPSHRQDDRSTSRDTEAARSENFRALTDRPQRKTRAYDDRSGRRDDRPSRASWNKDNKSRDVEFTGRPKSPNRPKKSRSEKGFVDVGEKELYGKKSAKAPYKGKRTYKSDKPKRSYR